MARYKIEFEVEIPDNLNASSDDVYEWARFNLGENGKISGKHPLASHPMESTGFSVLVNEVVE